MIISIAVILLDTLHESPQASRSNRINQPCGHLSHCEKITHSKCGFSEHNISRMKSFIVLLLVSYVSAQTCVEELRETICKDFEFGPTSTSLTSNTGILVLKNIKGSISKEHLANLSNVNEITIADSAIDQIEEGALCSLPKLTSLNILYNSKFPALTKQVLDGCSNVKKINMAGVVIENGCFETMSSLETITLNDDEFTGVPLSKATFSGLKSVKSLTIRQGGLEEIESDAFNDLTTLKNLDLQNNTIESLPGGVFQNLHQLKFLDLSENKLTKFESEGLKNLKVLFLDRNNIKNIDVDELLTNIPELERIFLSGKKITEEKQKVLDKQFSDRKVNLIYVDNE